MSGEGKGESMSGNELASATFGPVNRTTLALFAGASGDHNPIHIDTDFARRSGMPDVFAQGMLSMAYLGRFVTEWAGREKLRRWSARFVAMTPVNATLRCRAVDAGEAGDGLRKVELEVVTGDGLKTITGVAELEP